MGSSGKQKLKLLARENKKTEANKKPILLFVVDKNSPFKSKKKIQHIHTRVVTLFFSRTFFLNDYPSTVETVR
jgi:hypothetical protein